VALERKRAGVVHESEIVRRGLEACLADGPLIDVVFAAAAGDEAPDVPLDVAVVSPKALTEWVPECPVVLCTSHDDAAPIACEGVFAVIALATITAEQLCASAHAAALGLRVEADEGGRGTRIHERSRAVVRLLADGATTRTIAETLCYSERTVKTLIHDVERELGATTRAQAVAHAARLGLLS
jgi:DNA-binding NarL/FixJ family response regulator